MSSDISWKGSMHDQEESGLLIMKSSHLFILLDSDLVWAASISHYDQGVTGIH